MVVRQILDLNVEVRALVGQQKRPFRWFFLLGRPPILAGYGARSLETRLTFSNFRAVIVPYPTQKNTYGNYLLFIRKSPIGLGAGGHSMPTAFRCRLLAGHGKEPENR